jgi:hypothetical protein
MAYTTINKSTDYFNTKLYTGTGSSNAQTGIGHQPDLVWIKSRSAGWDHEWYDAVRGVGKSISTVTANAESNSPQGVTAFGSDGFTVGTRSGVNENNSTYASWNWKAGTGQGSSNTDGSINTTYTSVNTTAGFSISKYTGNGASNDTATIGHGLGVAPNMIMVKCINATGGWQTSSTSLGWNNVLQLNETNAQASGTYAFGQSGVTPTSTVFTVSATSGGNHTNTNNNTYIAYCFAEKTGYSKFGSYTGNGQTSGTFVYTGFKPAWVMWKHTSDTYGWYILNNKSDTHNPQESFLYANLSDAEADNTFMDFLSNGFKIRESGGGSNASGSTYIYMAFASAPLVGSNNIPANAR